MLGLRGPLFISSIDIINLNHYNDSVIPYVMGKSSISKRIAIVDLHYTLKIVLVEFRD